MVIEELTEEQTKKFFEEFNKIQERCCNCIYHPNCDQDCMFKHGSAFQVRPSLVESIKQNIKKND